MGIHLSGTPRIRITVLFLFSLITHSLSAQNIDFTKDYFTSNPDGLKDAQSNIRSGDEFFNAGILLYRSALEYYLKANEFNPDNAKLNYKIGVCYLYSSFKQKGIAHLEKAQKLDPEVNEKLPYFLGYANHLRMEWTKAIGFYETYKKKVEGKQLMPGEPGADADKKIQECRNGIELMKDTLRVSKLPDSLHYRLENMGPEVNTQFPDYGPVISADESILVFTSKRNTTSGGGMDEGQYFEDIYNTTSEGGKWAASKNIGDPINRSNAHDATCGISVDGQTLFIYIDDTYKGSGNIYECKLNGRTWSDPKKLASTVNSKYHESSASLSPDGKTIYFCSENPKDNTGLGFHDIFKSVKNEKGEWGEPENLGTTINTRYDERTVFMHPDGKTMYFSSRGHNTMGGLDLFKAVYNDSLKKWSAPVNLGYPLNSPDNDVFFVVSASGKHAYYSTVRPDGFGEQDIYKVTLPADTTVYLTLVKGTVSDESNNPVGAKVEIYNKKTGKLISTQESNSATGKFLVSLPSGRNYKMKVTANGYEDYNQDFNIPKGEKFKELDLAIKLKRKEQFVAVEGDVTDEKGKGLKAKVEIVNNATGEVIARTSADQLGKYLSKLKGGKNYGMTVSADGYLFQSINLDIPPDKDKLKLPPIILKKIEAGKNIVLNNIFFDFDRATLRPDSKPELQRVATVLRDNPSMKIELSGHTDNKGSATYNLKLSESRAKSVVDFLISVGIEKTRLSFKGYGFLKPIASNDTEEGRQQNRRTEFKVVSIDENAVSKGNDSDNTNTKPALVSKVPDEFKVADKNGDGMITADEIVAIIDGFFDGINDYTTEKVHRLIDYFFEQ